MSSLSSNLKQWGAQGSEYPNGYNYLEGEQPVDEWDNFLTYNLIEEIHALQSVVNDRMESDVTGGGTHPSSPEVGHLSHRTDTSNLPTSDEATFVYDGTNSVWHRLLKADGDKMGGALDMAGNAINDSASGDLTLGDSTTVQGAATISGSLTVSNTASFSSSLSVTNEADIAGAKVHHEWFDKQEGGTVAAGTAVPIGTFNLADGETLEVTQAMLTEDGFTTPADSGIDLRIVPESASSGSTTNTTVVLSGDGSTLYDDETGNPVHTSYQNTSGGPQTVAIMLDNGQYNSGTGVDTQAYGGFIARTV